ncbi:MAG: hypothetical protein ABI528_11075, partial [bacterium]
TNSVILGSNKVYIPLSRENLGYKAIENFFRVFNIREFYKINLYIKKFIPVGGGLGGGSSNAASIVKFLIKYFNIDIAENRKEILKLALSIGSDVPFFLMNKPCYAEGRGEILEILRDFNINYDILIVNPNLHVSTKWAFEKLNLGEKVIAPLYKNILSFDLSRKGFFVNDFEEIVFKKYNSLEVIKDELISHGAVFASMSGTGATMYALFEKSNREALKRSLEYYSEKNYFTYVSD